MVDVSVVIPTRDRPELLATAVRCALAQEGPSVEVIVVDDGSAPPVDLEPVASPANLLVRRHPDARGVSAARNTGIASARGEWIAFLDDDDVWAPTKLRRQLGVAEAQGRGWAYAGHVDLDSQLGLVGGTPPPDPDEVVAQLSRHNSVPAGASNVLVRSTVLGRAGGFDMGLHVHEDWDLWIRLAKTGPPACVPEPLVGLRWHSANASARMEPMLRELPGIAARHHLAVDYPRHLRWAAWTAMTSGRRRDAVRWYLSAASRGDLPSIGRAAVALARPRAAMMHAGDPPPGAWAREAEPWLRDLR